ncbi:MAG: GNAT family N-acetyltransferase [Planctomycetes bacterium]|nr:GNAT family N-acetyltransferase [Planctomycetota bacterium]
MSDLPRYGVPDGDAEKRAYAAIVAEAFAGEFETFNAWVHDFGADVRVLRDAGVLGGLVIYRMGQFFGGVSVPAWGIAGVGVRPELRAKGFAHELMLANLRECHDHGPPISTLYPAAPKLYRNLGWEFSGSRTAIGANLHELALRDHGLTLRPGTPKDDDILGALYSRSHQYENGCLDRSDRIWGRVRRVPVDTPLFCYIAERDGVPEGYTLYTQKRATPNSFRYDMLVRDFVATTPAAAGALIAHFARNRSVANRVQLYVAPDAPVLIELLRTQEVAVEQRMHWMLRIVRVKDALEGRGYNRHVRADAAISVIDEALPDNSGAWTLSLSDGHMTVRRGGQGPGLDIRGLAAMYSGSMGPPQLRAAGLLAGDDAHDSALAAMFAGTTPWMPDYF